MSINAARISMKILVQIFSVEEIKLPVHTLFFLSAATFIIFLSRSLRVKNFCFSSTDFIGGNMLTRIYLLRFTFFIAIISAIKSSDIMIDSDDPVDVNKESNNVIEKEDLKLQNNNICHMEVQVTRHIMGYCIKHGLATHSCVADGYLHPFHRECISSGK